MSNYLRWAVNSLTDSSSISNRRMCIQYAWVNGRRINVESIAIAEARRIQELCGVVGWQDITCTGEYDDDGLVVDSLRVWHTSPNGHRHFLEKTTDLVRAILLDQCGSLPSSL